MIHRLLLMLMIAGMLAPSHAGAESDDEKPSPFSLELSAGAEYDSNVAVLELDTSSGEGDYAAVIDFGVGYSRNVTKRLKLDLGYDFSQSLHGRFDQFDVRTHRGSTGIAYDFGGVKAGAALQYADATLDDDGFLIFKQASPYVSRLFGKRLFLRLGYSRTEKELETSPARDATADAFALDSFVLLDGVKRYLAFSLKHQDEDAVDDEFDYSGYKLKAQLSRKMKAGSRDVATKAALRYESRQYADSFLPGAERREDDRYRFEAQADVSLSRHWFLLIDYQYADNRSNVESVDFDEHVVSIQLGARL